METTLVVNSPLVTNDFGFAFIFQQSQGNEDDVFSKIQYVGTLKDILQLDYGPMFSPSILFCYNSMKMGLTIEIAPLTNKMTFFTCKFLSFIA
jgi:hypothetical protein